jgi:alkanesulfonate monooxygenase SsuD/methylene tetrahydromethanopterin reductase-like flavin-dependent oxidoreductase (luciferase family)
MGDPKVSFGYGLITCQRHPDDDRPDAALYAEALELATEAEELGFDSVWTSEHHFADDSYMPSVLPMSAAIAARTTKIRIGTGLALAPLYDPIRLAEDAATVDAISGARFILGLGLGWLDWELEALGASMSRRGVGMERAIRSCREAWGSGLLTEHGVAVFPKPTRDGGPPLWIGAHAEAAIRRAARMADGFLAGQPTPDVMREHCEVVGEELGRAGRDPGSFDVAGYWPVFVSDGGDAFEIVKPWLHYMEWKYNDAVEARGRLTTRPAPPPLDDAGATELREGAICGTPDEVEEQIRALLEAARHAGLARDRFTFVARMYYPGMPRDLMREGTRLFAEKVIPKFGQEATPASWRRAATPARPLGTASASAAKATSATAIAAPADASGSEPTTVGGSTIEASVIPVATSASAGSTFTTGPAAVVTIPEAMGGPPPTTTAPIIPGWITQANG